MFSLVNALLIMVWKYRGSDSQRSFLAQNPGCSVHSQTSFTPATTTVYFATELKPSLVPSPFSRRERKGPGIHCLRMCKISLEFRNCFRILNAIWRWSSIALACGCGYTSGFYWVFCFFRCYCLLPRQAWAVSYISEEGTALSNLGWVSGAGYVSQQGTMERVCVTSVYFSWWTTSTRKMGQNVLAKQSASRLVSPPMFGRH